MQKMIHFFFFFLAKIQFENPIINFLNKYIDSAGMNSLDFLSYITFMLKKNHHGSHSVLRYTQIKFIIRNLENYKKKLTCSKPRTCRGHSNILVIRWQSHVA